MIYPPFKYVGSKRRVLPRLLAYLNDIVEYREPFVGVGAVRLDDQIAEFFRRKVADADVKLTVRFLRLKPGKHEITVGKDNLMIVPRNTNK